MSTDVLIYNGDGIQLLGRVSLKHAIGMLHRNVARPKEWIEGRTVGPYPHVTSVELVKYVFTRWIYDMAGKQPFSRVGILRRDNYTCGYCGKTANTVDHVHPRCEGGKSTWENCISACWKCNNKKGKKLLHQAGMRLLWEPTRPKIRV